MSWNNASHAAVKFIFSAAEAVGEFSTLPVVRDTFNQMIDDFWLKTGYDLDAATMAWSHLGALALGAGRNAGAFPKDPEFAEHIAAVLVRKQTDYGHENIARFGNGGLLVRVHDKIARLENLAARGQDPKNESISDNYGDLVGYSAIGMMWNQETFMLPLEVTVAESN